MKTLKKQKGFSLIQAGAVGTIVSILFMASMSSSPTNSVSSIGAVASAQSALKMTHAQKIIEKPLTPFPTVSEIAAAMEKTTPRASGLCVSEGLKVETYSDYEGKQPTAGIDDAVKSVGSAVVEDADC